PEHQPDLAGRWVRDGVRSVLARVLPGRRAGRPDPREEVLDRLRRRFRRRPHVRRRGEVLRRDALSLCLGSGGHRPQRPDLEDQCAVLPTELRRQILMFRTRTPRLFLLPTRGPRRSGLALAVATLIVATAGAGLDAAKTDLKFQFDKAFAFAGLRTWNWHPQG